MDAQVQSDLLGMAEVAEEHWKQHGFCMQICLQEHVNPGSPYVTIDEDRIARVFEALGFADCVEGYDWNDEPGRTKEQVLDRIQSALNSA